MGSMLKSENYKKSNNSSVNENYYNKGLYNVRGFGLISARKFIDMKLGADTFDNIVRLQKRDWDGNINPLGWYDIDVKIFVENVIAERLGRSAESIVEEMSEYALSTDLRTSFRYLIKLINPVRVLTYNSKISNSYLDFINSDIVDNRLGICKMELKKVPSQSQYLSWLIAATSGGLKGMFRVLHCNITDLSFDVITNEREQMFVTVVYTLKYEIKN